MEPVYHYERQPGYSRLAGPGQAGLDRLEMGILRVPRDETHRFRLHGREAALVILSGACTVEVNGQSWSLERASVFAELPMAVYVPRHREYAVTGSKPTDLVVLTAAADEDQMPRLIDRDQIKIRDEGSGHFRRREYSIIGEGFPASRLLAGETFVEQGDWASYPPHKHDEDNYPHEVALEEIIFFQVDPPQGFGLQFVYSADRSLDAAYDVRNDDAVAIVRGYHPFVSAPGYSLYGLWGMAGDGHVIRSSPDPAHEWVAEEAGVGQRVAAPG